MQNFYYYAKLNDNDICVEIVSRVSKLVDVTGYVEIPEYNETLRYRKWEGNQWSNETYEPTVDTVVQDSLHNLELLIESQEEVVQNQQKEITRLTNTNAALNQKIESLEQEVVNSMLALAETYETLMFSMEEPI